MMLSETDTQHLRGALHIAVIKCTERCLYHSAKWAAELLDAIPESKNQDGSGPAATSASPLTSLLLDNADPEEAALEAKEVDKYLLAQTLFNCREFDRCASVFLPEHILACVLSERRGTESAAPSSSRVSTADAEDLPRISQKGLFLALYAKVMSGEKTKNEDSEMIMGPQDLGSVVNKQLLIVGKYLEKWFRKNKNEAGETVGSQGFLEYLYGMVLAKQKSDEAALRYLMESVHIYPWNWGCWQEMTDLMARAEDLHRIAGHLPQNMVSFIFHLHASVNLYDQSQHLSASINDLLNIFPTSSFLLTDRALHSYHCKDLVVAEQEFSHLLSLHPHRLDSLDHYSNLLYVLNLRPKLAFLAHLCTSIDKFRPESCVVIGNYYSLLSMHEKAVQYFRRALTLDRTCLSAWTLMGHEYVELKNTHAAIESYRRAVDVNRRDYRAWYGLGQTYEVLEMHAYALWYYKMAAGLRPHDGKMWQAVGSCLEKMGRYRDGIKALKRALLADTYYDSSVNSSFGSGGSLDRMAQIEPEILLQIAYMYEKLGEEDEAKSYMELCVAQEVGGAAASGGAASSLLDSSPDAAADNGDDNWSSGEAAGGGYQGREEGTGVTVATSKARMWLARHAMRNEDYAEANRLASELCHDGVEVEEAKALIREANARMELEGSLEGR